MGAIAERYESFLVTVKRLGLLVLWINAQLQFSLDNSLIMIPSQIELLILSIILFKIRRKNTKTLQNN